MTDLYKYQTNCPPYPGEFIPAINAKDVGEEYKKRGHPLGKEPLTNITELKDSYRVEVAVPGAKRENIYVRISRKILTVIVLNKSDHYQKKQYQLHEFNHNFERHILLPGNIDSQFVVAEYKEGVLYVHLSKTEYPLKPEPVRIVVY